MGTVMGWVDKKGVRHQTLVLDASYRNNLYWSYPNVFVSGMPALTNTRQWYFNNGSSISTTTTSITVTDTTINNTSGYFEDTLTSRQNTTYMMGYSYCNTTSRAAGWCRSKQVTHDGGRYGCDLPNMQTLIRIYCSMFKLDELDPTPNGSKYLFTRARSKNSYNWYLNCGGWAWSSSQYDTGSAWLLNYTGYMVGYTDGNDKAQHEMGVTPILDIL